MIICVNNNKGGILKTTTVTNLAGVLASLKKKVLIVDADSQSNVALSFGVNPDELRTSLYDVLVGGLPPEDTIISVHEYIDLIPSNTDLISLDFDVIGNPSEYPNPFMMMKEAMQHLESQYDYILIDTPPALSLIVGNAFAWANKVLIPYKPEFYSMRSLLSVVDTINDFKAEYNPKLEVLGILNTIVKTRTNLHADITQQTNVFASGKQIQIFDIVIPDTIEFANSVAYHRLPATLVFRKFSGKLLYESAKLYYELWEEIDATLKEGAK